MEAPKCKICGQRHYGLCPQAKGGEANIPGHDSRASEDDANKTQPRAAKKRAVRGSFDRKAYQREYMRKRRAKGK